MKKKDATVTKSRILHAAKAEFAESGFAGARMSVIAKKAKANQALLHYYFCNKEKLYEEVLERIFDKDLMDEMISFIDKTDESPSIRLRAVIYLMCRAHFEILDPDLNRIILRELAGELRHLKSLIQNFFIPPKEYLVSLIQEGIDRGEFETKSPLFVILNLDYFTDNFINYRELYRGTKFENEICLPEAEHHFEEFLTEHTFKAISPNGSSIEIPILDDSIVGQLDVFVKRMANRYGGDSHKE